MPCLIARSYRAHPTLFLLPLLLVFMNAGCGGNSSSSQIDCTVALGLDVIPQSGTADHTLAPPGNKVNFFGADSTRPGCPPVPGPIRLDLKWTVSDTVNTKIGNTANVDYGVATCINATPAPVTVTATGTNRLGTTITGTGTLTCK
jgi:hypothetical protein